MAFRGKEFSLMWGITRPGLWYPPYHIEIGVRAQGRSREIITLILLHFLRDYEWQRCNLITGVFWIIYLKFQSV